MTSDWSEEELDILNKMTKEGRSASEISRRLSTRTRGAVIGKWHRSDWYIKKGKTRIVDKRKKGPPRVKKIRPHKVKDRIQQREERIEQVAINLSKIDDPPTAEEVERGKFLLDLSLDNECRWVVMSSTDTVPALFCALPRSAKHHRYCPAHAKAAHVPLAPRKMRMGR